MQAPVFLVSQNSLTGLHGADLIRILLKKVDFTLKNIDEHKLAEEHHEKYYSFSL